MQAIVSDILTTYIVKGKGKVVLMLHGWGDEQGTFKLLAESISHDFKVVTVDLPGFGKTAAPNSIWTLDDYARFVASFLEKLEIVPYGIVGHSNGGAICLRGLASGVLQAEKLVLLASSGIRDEYQGRKKVMRFAAKTVKALVSPLPKRVRRKLKKQAYRSIGSDLFVAEHLQETFKQIVTDDVTQDAAKISTPTLLIYGKRDEATPIRYAEKFRSLISGSKLEIIDEAGHFVHHEQPVQVVDFIREFLA